MTVIHVLYIILFIAISVTAIADIFGLSFSSGKRHNKKPIKYVCFYFSLGILLVTLSVVSIVVLGLEETGERLYLFMFAHICIALIAFCVKGLFLFMRPKKTVHTKVLSLTVKFVKNGRPVYTAHMNIFDGSSVFDEENVHFMPEFSRFDFFATFEFPDGSEKEFDVKAPYYHNGSLKEGGTGTLTYKESKNSKSWKDRRFVSYREDGVGCSSDQSKLRL